MPQISKKSRITEINRIPNRELFGYYKIKTQKYNTLCSGKLTGVVLHICGKLYGKKVQKSTCIF